MVKRMSRLDEIQKWLIDRLPGLLAENRIPGAAVAVAAGTEVIDYGAGVLSLATGVEATADSVFQVGSITKLWTATLVMQLVEEGAVELDAPVRRYLPGFRVADEAVSAAVTVRQLLTHTSGFAGDIFTDTGRGDDAVEKYVDSLGDVEQVFAPGTMFSYNNAGYTVLGRIIEVLRGRPFAVVLRERLIEPLGLTHTAIGAEQAIMYRAAVGHLPTGPDEAPEPAPVWNLPASHVPAGSLLAMRPRDLIGFARLHLTGGGELLSAASVAAMQQPQVELPPLSLSGDAWGLGWEIDHRPDGTVIGHTGGTLGQSSILHIVPAADVAVVLVVNGGDVTPAYREIFGRVLGELAGMRIPEPERPPAAPERVDGQRYLGVYSSPAADTTISQNGDGRIWLTAEPKGLFAELGTPSSPIEIVRLRGDEFLHAEAQQGEHRRVSFLGDDGQGHAQFLHGGRVSRRVAPTTGG